MTSTGRNFLRCGAWVGAAFVVPLALVPARAFGVDRIAASPPSLANVQAAVNLAVDGDRVLIPNGSAAWFGGISTTKQIRIQAQNYTPTPAGTTGAGATTRNVTITNNSSSPLLDLTSGNTFHVGVGGIRFNEGSGNGNAVRFNGSGSKVPLLYDCYFQVKPRNGNQPDVSVVPYLGLGGVTWNCVFDATGFDNGQSPGSDGACSVVRCPRAWASPSTMGMLDVTGTQNSYFEDCTWLHIFNQAVDAEDDARAVVRHCLLRNTQFLTHGSTGFTGGRHVEFYDNAFQFRAVPSQPLPGNPNGDVALVRYMWFRAGTGLFANNTFEDIQSGTWGPQSEVVLTVENLHRGTFQGAAPCPCTAYPCFHQIGQGHNGTSQVSDPMYFWNNIGTMQVGFIEGSPEDCFGGGASSTFAQLNRDYFVGTTPKPSTPGSPGAYQKFTYPHPFRAVVEGGGAPLAPTNLRFL